MRFTMLGTIYLKNSPISRMPRRASEHLSGIAR